MCQGLGQLTRRHLNLTAARSYIYTPHTNNPPNKIATEHETLCKNLDTRRSWVNVPRGKLCVKAMLSSSQQCWRPRPGIEPETLSSADQCVANRAAEAGGIFTGASWGALRHVETFKSIYLPDVRHTERKTRQDQSTELPFVAIKISVKRSTLGTIDQGQI